MTTKNTAAASVQESRISYTPPNITSLDLSSTMNKGVKTTPGAENGDGTGNNGSKSPS